MGNEVGDQGPPSSQDPRRLGDFEIVRELGRGGMGIVYEARQLSLNRKVALKVLKAGLAVGRQAIERFQREAESAARLHHTNIVPIYATGSVGDTYFYAMELIDGPSLDHVIRQIRRGESGLLKDLSEDHHAGAATIAYSNSVGDDARTPHRDAVTSSNSSNSQYFDEIARRIAEVADALHYAHTESIVHRDIKPSNLLMASSGRYSLNDFGLARVLDEPGMTATGEILGTPSYMSPEQIAAGRTPLDHRTDIYSLGATLYELLTLTPPFQGQRRDQVLAQILHKEPQALRKINRRIPVDLETICLKAMEKDPDRRYATAAEMADDLRRYVNRFAIAARRTSTMARMVKWVRRHPGMAIGASCSILAGTVAVFMFLHAQSVEQQRLQEYEIAQSDLARVKREAALESAVVAATSGDLEKAEAAIRVAELNGATPAQLRMLRGQLAYFRGEYEKALVELEQAVKLNPDSAAATGLLAVTHMSNGDYSTYEQIVEKLQNLSATTPEDYLFKGYADFDLTRGIVTLGEAVKRSHSPMARSLRAELRAFIAHSKGDIAATNQAITDMEVATESLSDNPLVQTNRVLVYWTAHVLNLEKGITDKTATYREEAIRSVQQLLATTEIPPHFIYPILFLDSIGDHSAALSMAQKNFELARSPVFAQIYACLLYRNGQCHEALEVLNRRNRREAAGDQLRAFLLADLNPGDLTAALEACREMTEKYDAGVAQYAPQQVLRFLGKNNDALEMARRLRDGGKELAISVRHRPHVQYYCGELSEVEFIAAFDEREGQCNAHFDVGLSRLAIGDRVGAREHFQKAASITIPFNYNNDWSRIFVARMEQDPSWPSWIPEKK